jgi:hypothetical protein
MGVRRWECGDGSAEMGDGIVRGVGSVGFSIQNPVLS